MPTKIHFKNDKNDRLFMQTLRGRVNDYFKTHQLKKTSNAVAKWKAVIMFLAYFGVYGALFFVENVGQLYGCYALSGILTIFVALNVAHDAAHGTFSDRKWVNDLLLYTFDMLGASGYMWRLKHVHSHHPHVNIPGLDGDIKQSNLVRIFPNAPYFSIHRYQYLYMPVLYLFYTIFWLLFRDFKDFFQPKVSGKPHHKIPLKEFIKLGIGKLFFLGRMLLLPYLLLPFSFLQILLCFVIFHFCASQTVALALISAHVGEHSVCPAPDQDGNMPTSWVRHQIVTTCDFATKSSLVTHLFGGFNHHIVHHLFPNTCHIHYPELTKILVSTCQEFGMPYQSNPTLGDAVLSHLRFLKMRSRANQSVPYLEM